MADVVERVARAIYHCQPRNKPYDLIDPVHRRYWEKRAEAAIEAMREPAEAMNDAGEEARRLATTVYMDGSEVADGDMVEHVYRAMIDTALASEPKP